MNDKKLYLVCNGDSVGRSGVLGSVCRGVVSSSMDMVVCESAGSVVCVGGSRLQSVCVEGSSS